MSAAGGVMLYELEQEIRKMSLRGQRTDMVIVEPDKAEAMRAAVNAKGIPFKYFLHVFNEQKVLVSHVITIHARGQEPTGEPFEIGAPE